MPFPAQQTHTQNVLHFSVRAPLFFIDYTEQHIYPSVLDYQDKNA